MPDAPDATLEAPLVAVPPSDAAPVAATELDLGYHVTLDSFSGPLDLLLFLVRRTEVDIADIQVATIADQFVAMLKATPDLDLDVAGDFILMAATLLELKSRLVMPAEEPKEGEDEVQEEDEVFDPRAGLIRQLLTYRRFKEATQLLPQLEEAQCERLGRGLREIIPEDPEEVDGLDLENCDAGLLYETWEGVLVYLNRLGPRTVLNDDVPLEHKINALVDAMRAAREAKLSWMFAQETTTSGRVGVLMATLECARQRFVEALQHEQFGDVLLRYREDADRTRTPELPPEPLEEAKKRRKRLPLVTWRAPERTTQPEQQEIDLDTDEAEEAVVETDEQRFHRELEEACAVEAVLTRTADIESSFSAFRTQQQLDAQMAADVAKQSPADPDAVTEPAAPSDVPPEVPLPG
jgi:segregation and condensation protein A